MSQAAAALAMTLMLISASGASASMPAGHTARGVLPAWQLAQAARDEREAAQQAAQRYGGKVLRVERQGSNFEVRLLMPDGRVKHVVIPGNAKAGRG